MSPYVTLKSLVNKGVLPAGLEKGPVGEEIHEECPKGLGKR